MIRHSLLSIALASTVPGALAADQFTSWPQWEESTNKAHQALVAKIKKADAWSNCMSWGTSSRRKTKTPAFWAVQEYLLHHSAINGADLGGVNDRVPKVGMTTCGVFAVLGRPDDINRTDSSGGRRSQYVYRARGVYVYTNTTKDDWNALVTSVQH